MEVSDLSPTPADRYARLVADHAIKPPVLEQWLEYWNDAESDLVNLGNLEHWLSRASRLPGNSPATQR
jgi:hypothetical protein